MINDNNMKNYSFSLSKFHIFCVENGGKLLLVVIAFIFLIAFFYNADLLYLKKVFHIILILCLLFYLVGKLLKKFVYEITIDFDNQIISFKTYRNKESIVFDFNEVKIKQLKGYIIFYTPSKKIIYNGEFSQELLLCIKRIKEKQAAL